MSAWGRKKPADEAAAPSAAAQVSTEPKVVVLPTDDPSVKVLQVTYVDDDGKKRRTTKRIQTREETYKVDVHVNARTKLRRFGMGKTGVYVDYESGDQRSIEVTKETLHFVKSRKTNRDECDTIIEDIVQNYGPDAPNQDGQGELYQAPNAMMMMMQSRVAMDMPEENTTLRVSNLSEEMDEGVLRNLVCRALGIPEGSQDIRFVLRRIVVNYDHRDETYYAFIRFARREDAQKVLDTFNGLSVSGYVIRMEWARPRRRY